MVITKNLKYQSDNNGSGEKVERLSEIKRPTLVLGCTKDLLVSPSHSEFLAEKIQGVKLVIWPNTGHIPQSRKTGSVLQDSEGIFEMKSLHFHIKGIESFYMEMNEVHKAFIIRLSGKF